MNTTPLRDDDRRALLAAAGVAAGSEADGCVTRWLAASLAAGPPAGWRTQLAAAVARALDLYRVFNHGFEAFFYGNPTCVAAVYVRNALKARLGTDHTPAVEAVLDRIRGRRERLMDAFFTRRQKTLFAPAAVDPARLRGFFVRVADVESYHVPPDDLPTHRAEVPDFGQLPAREPDDEPGGAAGLRDRAGRLVAFWGDAHGFRAAERDEGLTGLGLGGLTGNAAVAERCSEWLTANLPDWEAERDRLREWVGRRLAQHERARRKGEPPERVAELELELARLRVRLTDHADRLRPKPAEVARILGWTAARVGGVRYARIGREVEVLKRRVLAVSFGPAPAAVAGLLADVAAHVPARPPTPSGKGLTDAERVARLQADADWLTRTEALLARGRELARAGVPVPGFAGWLTDFDELFAWGLLERVGVIAALSRRDGRRVDRLLRVG